MDPSLTTGTRKELTALDLAFLRDIGWETIIPNLSSADFNGDGSVDGDDFLIWQSNFGTPTSAMRDDGDSDGDGDVDGDDFLAWQAQFGSASSAAAGSGSFASTPEPAGSLLACLAFSLAGAAQRLIGRRGMIKEVRVA